MRRRTFKSVFTNGLLKRIGMSVTVFSMLFSSFACAVHEDSFPSIPDPDVTEATVVSSDDTSVPDISFTNITVALPYSDETVKLLGALYYAKSHDLFGDTTGLDVDIDYLNSLNPDFQIQSIQTTSEGASISTLSQWVDMKAMPDLFLTNDMESAIEGGYTISMNDYLWNNQYINSNTIYTGALTDLMYNGEFYGVPLYMSVMIMMGNSDYVPSTGRIPMKYTTEDLYEYLTEIKAEYGLSGVVPLSSASSMVPYIGSAFNEDMPTSYMLRSEYRSNPEETTDIVNEISSYMNSLYRSGLSSNQSANGADPVYSRNAAMWMASSSEVSYWSEYYPGKLYFVQLPCNSLENNGVPMTSVYSLCMSNTTDCPELASDFASFIAFDNDAQLLINRLEPQTGFFPVVTSSDVWTLVESDSTFGNVAAIYEQILTNSVYVSDGSDNASINTYLSSYSGGNLNVEVLCGN